MEGRGLSNQFMLVVEGDMLDPELKAGDHFSLEFGAKPTNGNFVLAYLKTEKYFVFRNCMQ